jgi:hypothetical protein
VLDPSREPHADVVASACDQGGEYVGVPGVSVMSGVSTPRMWGRYWDLVQDCGVCDCVMCVAYAHDELNVSGNAELLLHHDTDYVCVLGRKF